MYLNWFKPPQLPGPEVVTSGQGNQESWQSPACSPSHLLPTPSANEHPSWPDITIYDVKITDLVVQIFNFTNEKIKAQGF